MADIDFQLTVRFDGGDADAHEIDLFQLGESLQGLARITATAGNFAATGKYSRYFPSHDVRVVAKEPRPNCFSLDVVWNFVSQHQLLSGSFGPIAAALIPYLFVRAARKEAEVKALKESLALAIEKLADRDDGIKNRLLDLVEKMADDLRPSVRRAVSPVGNSCKTLTINMGVTRTSVDEADKAVICNDAEDEITETRELEVYFTEMDKERDSCLARLVGHEDDKRIKAKITDPVFETENNPYVLAFAEGSSIAVRAKLLIKNGELDKMFISDLA